MGLGFYRFVQVKTNSNCLFLGLQVPFVFHVIVCFSCHCNCDIVFEKNMLIKDAIFNMSDHFLMLTFTLQTILKLNYGIK